MQLPFQHNNAELFQNGLCYCDYWFVTSASNHLKPAALRMASSLAPTIRLNNGYEMPILGLGTYMLLKDKGLNAMRAAIDIGYRHIDTAYLYRNEHLVGQALQEKIAQGILTRKQIFIVTKLWDIFHEPERVEYACRKQLKSLGTNYIDVYLMHSPVGYLYLNDEALMPHEQDRLLTNNIDYLDTYKAMEKLVDLGLVRSLGLSNFNSLQIARVLQNCRIKPVNLQVECHPLLNQRQLIEFCRSHNIVVTAYSPLARFKPTKPTPKFLNDTQVLSMGIKYGKTACQIALRYLSTKEDGEKAVKGAIDIGYRHIDTAYFYQNEAEIGKAIREKIAEGVCKREDIFLVTKLWNIHHAPCIVESACRRQLKLLDLDYIDLYLMHMPVGYKYVNEETLLPKNEHDELELINTDYVDTYKAMEKLVKLGLVRSLGVSNFNSEQINRVLKKCEIKPVTNQVECHPGLNQKQLTKFCKQNDIVLTAYTPLGRPNPEKRSPHFYYSQKTKDIAEKYSKTPGQIILRYLIDIGVIPIPKSSNLKRINENFQIFNFKLEPEELAVMDSHNPRISPC